MKKGLFDKRIPTLFALLALVVVVIISTLLIQSGIFYVGKAAPDTQPQNFAITNITDTSFTATFTTVGQVEGVVRLNSASTGTSLTLDDRDKKGGKANKYYSHHITIPNLSPNTSYTFTLIAGGKEYQDTSFSVKTAGEIDSPPPAQNPLFGKVLLPDGTVGNDTIIVTKTDNSSFASAVTDGKGEFIIPTNSMRNSANNVYISVQKTTPFELIFYRQLMKASVNTTFEIAQNLPPVTLLQEYTFKKEQETQPAGTSQLTFVEEVPAEDAVSIRRPRQDEEFIDRRPVFSGTSYPNSSVALLIPGVAQQQVLARADGSWSFQPSNNIPQGDHTITITVIDAEKNEITVTRRFVIFPLGSQVAETATPSATPTFLPTATPTVAQVTPTATIAPTAAPSAVPSSIPTITATETPTPLPTIYQTPTPAPPIDPPGAYENAAVLTGFSVVLIIAGLALLFVL